MTLAISPPSLSHSRSLPPIPTTPTSPMPTIPLTPSSGSKPIKPNPHPYAIKTTSTGVLSRSNSSGHNAQATYFYTPPRPSTPLSSSPTRSRGRADSQGSATRNSEYRGHRYSTSLISAAEYEVNGKSARSGSESSTSDRSLPGSPSISRSASDDGPTPPSKPRVNIDIKPIRAETLPPIPASQSPTPSPSRSVCLSPDTSRTSPFGCHGMGMEDLQSNPKLWTPTQLSAYLITALRVRSIGNVETASLPMPVAKDIAAWVKATRITGRVFLRWEEEDLEGLGLNLLWRNALLNASRNLRQNVLKGRIWGPPSPTALPSPTASPSPSPASRFRNGDPSVTADDDGDNEEGEGDGSGRFNFSSSALYASASSSSSLDLPGTLSDPSVHIPDLSFGTSPSSTTSSLKRGGRIPRSKFKGRPSAGIGEKDGRVKGMVDKWEVKSSGSVSGSENENEGESRRDEAGGGWVATRRKSGRKSLGRVHERDGCESGVSASESEGEGDAIVGHSFDEIVVNGAGLDLPYHEDKNQAQDERALPKDNDEDDDDDAFFGHDRHVVSISHSTFKPQTAPAFHDQDPPASASGLMDRGSAHENEEGEEPSIEDLLASESQSPTKFASSARSWGARAWEDMEIGETMKRISSVSPNKEVPLPVTYPVAAPDADDGVDGEGQEGGRGQGQGTEWVTMRKVVPSVGRAGGADFDFDLGSVRGSGGGQGIGRGSMKGSMSKKMRIGKGTGSIRVKDKGERKGIDGLFDVAPPLSVEIPDEAEESQVEGPEVFSTTAVSEPAPELVSALDEMERVMQVQVQSSRELLEMFRARLEEVERRVKDMEEREQVRERDLEDEREATARLSKEREAEVLAFGAKMREAGEKVEEMKKELEETRDALARAQLDAESRASADTSSSPVITEIPIPTDPTATPSGKLLSVDGLNINPSTTLAKLVPSFARSSDERHSGTRDGAQNSPNEISELPSYVVLAGLGVCVVVLQVVFRRVLTGRRS